MLTFFYTSAVADSALLPAEAVTLLSADPLPEQSLDPRGDYLLLVHKSGLQPMDQLDEPSIKVAGLRINPVTNARAAAMPYVGLSLVDLESGETQRLPLPNGARIGYPQWAPDGGSYVFTSIAENGVELWIGRRGERRLHRLVGPVLNAARSRPCEWMPDSRRLVCRTVVQQHGDDYGVEQLLHSRLALVDTDSGSMRPLGEPANYQSISPSPDGAYLLVERSPMSQVRDGRPVGLYEVRDLSGAIVDRPGAGDSRPRAVHWLPSAPSTLVWAERSGGTDHILVRRVPFSGPPRLLYETPYRFAGLQWVEQAELALFSEYEPEGRVTRVRLIGPGVERPRLIGNRNIDGRGPAMGYPLTRADESGKLVVAVHDGAVFLRGGVTEDGGRSLLTRLNLETLESERIWPGSVTGYEEVLELIDGDPAALLTRHEGRLNPPDYLIRNLATGTARSVTDRHHPVPAMLDVERRFLRYTRTDGISLTATLYLPPGATGEPGLPLILWAYPRQYGPGSVPFPAAPDHFMDIEHSLRLFFVLLGYAVMDEVAMPVMGKPDEANDTFVEQIVANARAAIDAAAATGVVDPERVAVAGHSYGANMAASLLVHSRLFKAGVGLSGAYNRTLTPFGFQTEKRTLWEARETYLKMSPFLYSDRIDAPLLLVHGLLDNNAGTSPVQSRYFHEAIRRNGGESELLLLPGEGHVYRGVESVMRTASSMASFVARHLGSGQVPAAADQKTAMNTVLPEPLPTQ